MVLRTRGRSAHGEDAELDPRFFADSRPAGNVDNQRNRGGLVTLVGTDAGSKAKLIKVSGISDSSPWLAAVSANYRGYVGGAAGPTAGVWATGTVGSGGGTVPVAFDVKPDSNIQLPGDALDIDVGWAPVFLATNATDAIPAVNLASLPQFADVSAVICRGTSSRGSTTFTQRFFTGQAGVYQFRLPPFADKFMAYAPTANYAFLTTIEFTTSEDPAFGQVIASYTAAQVQAILAAGNLIPVPGMAQGLRVTTSAGTNFWLTHFLSL
jgi:hypothetical protein